MSRYKITLDEATKWLEHNIFHNLNQQSVKLKYFTINSNHQYIEVVIF